MLEPVSCKTIAAKVGTRYYLHPHINRTKWKCINRKPSYSDLTVTDERRDTLWTHLYFLPGNQQARALTYTLNTATSGANSKPPYSSISIAKHSLAKHQSKLTTYSEARAAVKVLVFMTCCAPAAESLATLLLQPGSNSASAPAPSLSLPHTPSNN